MYEEFRHPRFIQAKAWYDAKVAERRAEIEAYLTANDISITDEIIEKYFIPYKRRLQRQVRDRITNTGLYVFAELPINFLDLTVPNALPWNTKTVVIGTDDDGFPVYEEQSRTMSEYLQWYVVSLDNTKVLFRMGGKPHEGARPVRVKEAEIALWQTLLENRGYDWNNAGTLAQAKQRRNSVAYNPL